MTSEDARPSTPRPEGAPLSGEVGTSRSAPASRTGPEEQAVVSAFHRLYYERHERTWSNTSFLGVKTQKCPLDLWVYQEMVWEIRPDVILECGTADGGSALFLASMCDLVGKGRVVTVDILDRPGRPSHPRITYLRGSSVAPDVVDVVRRQVGDAAQVIVLLDSDHSAPHVSKELQCYAPLVSVGSYLVVEDTNVNGHPVLSDFGPGPWEAVEEFLSEHDEFKIDEKREKFYLTFNPRGFLRRLR